MSRPRCLVTGIIFSDVCQGRWAYGDLHRLGDTYVCNSTMVDGETAWNYDPMPVGRRAVECLSSDAMFERRGVIVVNVAMARLNEVALNYTNGEK